MSNPSEKNHPVALTVFVALVALTLFSVVKNGISSGQQGAAAGDLEEIRSGVNQAIQLAEEGRASGGRSKIEEAVGILEDLVKKHPDQADVWLNKGLMHRALGDLHQAEACFSETVRLNPRDWDAVAEQAGVVYAMGKKEEAIALLESIPAGEGRMFERLRRDKRWKEEKDANNEAVVQLYKKHAVEVASENSQRLNEKAKKEKARRERLSKKAP